MINLLEATFRYIKYLISILITISNISILTAQVEYDELLKSANESKDISSSLEYLDKAISINNTREEAYYQRALSRIRSKNYLGAEEDLSQAIEINSDNEHYFYERGIVRNYLMKHTEAMNDLNTAIKINSKFGEAYCARGTIKNILASEIPAKYGNKDKRKAKRLGINCFSKTRMKRNKKNKNQ